MKKSMDQLIFLLIIVLHEYMEIEIPKIYLTAECIMRALSESDYLQYMESALKIEKLC